MKSSRLKLIPIICLIIIFSSCQKEIEKDDKKIIYNNPIMLEIVDSNLFPNTIKGIGDIGIYFLDLDMDHQNDLRFELFSGFIGRQSLHYSRIETLNGFEMAVGYYPTLTSNTSYWPPAQKDTTIVSPGFVMAPAILNSGDTVSERLTYRTGLLDIAEYDANSFAGRNWFFQSKYWAEQGVKYIGVRNKKKRIYCQLKLNVTGYSTIMLYSGKTYFNKEYLIISE